MTNNANIYHNQADIDVWAKEPDKTLKSRIIETTLDAIMESYNEWMQDLLYEAQEAY